MLKTLNFVGTGNTFLQRGDTIDVSISGGGGGGGLGTAINYVDGTTSPFSFFDAHAEVTENLNLDEVVVVVQHPMLYRSFQTSVSILVLLSRLVLVKL